MEEYSSVQGCCKAYESPELRVVRVVRDDFLSASEPHLIGYVGGELFGVDGNSWGGLGSGAEALMMGNAVSSYGGLSAGEPSAEGLSAGYGGWTWD